jgi:hypothetical protein
MARILAENQLKFSYLRTLTSPENTQQARIVFSEIGSNGTKASNSLLQSLSSISLVGINIISNMAHLETSGWLADHREESLAEISRKVRSRLRHMWDRKSEDP